MEHISKEEGTPKEGYLTKETAREAALTMQYKYGTSFAVYKCNQCGFYHIGRNGGIKMENDNQNRLETETQPNGIIQPVYGFITAKTIKKLTYKLNKRAMDGYRPIWDKLEECEGEGFRIPIYNHDLLPDTAPVDENELAIIEALDLAEGHVIETSTSLTDEKNRLLIDTDYILVNAERQAMDPPRPPVKTAPEKKAWVETQLTERENDSLEAKRWKKYVEAMAKKGQLPQRESPWDLKARLKEEEAQAKDEIISKQAVPEKVGAPDPEEAQEAE